MIVLLHQPNLHEAPDAVWWTQDGELKCFEAEVRPELASAWQTLSDKVPDVPWEDYFVQLADRLPVFSNWEVVETEDESPWQLLRRLRREILAS